VEVLYVNVRELGRRKDEMNESLFTVPELQTCFEVLALGMMMWQWNKDNKDRG